VPTKVTLDAYAADRGVREIKEDGEPPRRVKVGSSQYLNNLVEQDHRRVKQRPSPERTSPELRQGNDSHPVQAARARVDIVLAYEVEFSVVAHAKHG
jgi:transposase-like protein